MQDDKENYSLFYYLIMMWLFLGFMNLYLDTRVISEVINKGIRVWGNVIPLGCL